MFRGLLLCCASGCSLYFSEAAAPDAAMSTSLDSASSDSARGADAGAVDPGVDPASGCTPPTVASDRWIAFDSDRDLFNRDLYVMRADGSDIRRLTTETSIDKEPAPSFDGAKIAFTSNRSGSFQIHILDLTTNVVTQLTTRGAQEPAFSHDGTMVAFRSGTAIYTIRTNGSDERFVTDSGLDLFNAYFNPQFSADDTEIYFDRNNELDAIRVDGTGFRYVVNNWTTTIKAPTITANGLAVAYQTRCDIEGDSIWLTAAQMSSNPCTGRRATAVDPGRHDQSPALGPDNIIAFERVYIASGVAALALVDTTPNSQLCPISTDPYDHRNPAWLIRANF